MIKFTVIPKKPFGTWQFGKIDILQGIARFFKICQDFSRFCKKSSKIIRKNDFDICEKKI